MIFDSIKLVEASEINEIAVVSGTAFPAAPLNGELFFRTDSPNVGLYLFYSGTWNKFVRTTDNIVSLLPELGLAGTYGTVSQVPVFEIDGKGRVLTVTNTAIQISEAQVAEGILLARVADNEQVTGDWEFTNGATVKGTGGNIPAINPDLLDIKDGDIRVVGSVISIYADGVWNQVFPALP